MKIAILGNGALGPAEKAYVECGQKHEYHNRYLTKCRNPWYKLEFRKPAPILLNVFSRDGYKVVRNFTSAVTLTCFHGFYPNLFGMEYVDHLFVYLLSKTGRRILENSRRRYGDGLDKFEPNDLNTALVPAPAILADLPPRLIKAVLSHPTNHKLIGEADALLNKALYRRKSAPLCVS